MKYMKLGNRPDTFYTEEATRSVSSDMPSDLTIEINNIKYLLHKIPLVTNCGLLQQLCNDIDDSVDTPVELHEIPGGEEAFELCAKFCYGIMINLSAHNFVPAICTAKFLRMTESVQRGNFVLKLEAFFNACILQGWKDSVVALQTTVKLPEWSENTGIVGRCIDSIVEKILTHPSKVAWSFTYTRPGYSEKHHRSVPKDWWTEDISDLGIDLFRCIISVLRSSKKLAPPLIGEALHVYACRWLPDASKVRTLESSIARSELDVQKQRYVLESIVSMIPTDRESVSGGFLLRLLKVACLLGTSSTTKAELVRRSARKLDEVTVNDLLVPSQSPSDGHFYDTNLVGAILENFLALFGRHASHRSGNAVQSMIKVAELIDGYLQVVASDVNMPVSKMVSLAESLPEFARPVHNELYKAIDIYLKEHPELSKIEKKRLCQILDCRKLSTDMCMHAVRNERLPLRTVVQVLFTEQERAARVDIQQKPRHEYVVIDPPNTPTDTEVEQSTAEARTTGKEKAADEEILHRRTTKLNAKQKPTLLKAAVKKVVDAVKGMVDTKEERFEASAEAKGVETKANISHGKKAREKHE